jgi:AAA family ATP:ADP antiporter
VSVLFLFAFSAASHRMSRAALFNAILVGFMAFFGGFALVLYPNADVLHPHALADQMQQVRVLVCVRQQQQQQQQHM